MQRVALKANAAVEGRCNVACLDGAGKDFSGGGVQRVEGGIAGRGHRSCSFSQLNSKLDWTGAGVRDVLVLYSTRFSRIHPIRNGRIAVDRRAGSAAATKRRCVVSSNETMRLIRYSGSIMSDRLPAGSSTDSLDPIRLTRQLCEIESTTYHEGAVGDFLADFLAGRGWEVEKTPVEQPTENAGGGPRWNVYAGAADETPDLHPTDEGLSVGTPDLVFSTHMDTVPPYIPFSEDEEFVYGRGVCDAKGILAAQVAAAEALRAAGFRIGLLFFSGEERDSAGAMAANQVAQRQPLPDQRRAHRQPPGAGFQGRLARGLQVHGQDGPLGLSRTGRERRSQAGRGVGQAAGHAVAGA